MTYTIQNSRKHLRYDAPPVRVGRGGRGTQQTPAPTFRDFIAEVNPRYVFYRHCEVLIGALQRVADGEIHRLMVFCPPRHSKSETVSRLFPAYYLLRHPERFVGLTSYAADLAYGFSRTARDNYTRAGGQMRGDAGAVKYWLTPSGGGLWATGVGGPITGRGAHLAIIDDPLKNAEEAASETIRTKQQDWYASTLQTRLEPESAVILVLTRWNEADLAGHLLDLEAEEPEHWTVVRMPALAETLPPLPETCQTIPDWREPGAALCPERYDAEKLGKLERRIGPYYFGALYQQRPAPRAGGMFDRADFRIVDAAPADIVARVRYWDLAGADVGKGDYTVGTRMARTADGRFIVEDVVRGQWPAAARNRVIGETIRSDGRNVPQVIEQAPGLAKEATDAIIRENAGWSVRADKVSADKVTRADPWSAQCQAGNVSLLRATWNRAFIDEHQAFPHGVNDDQVDTGSGAIAQLAAHASSPVRSRERKTNVWRQA